MVLSTEWSQVEVIDLINDGNGLGFILVGGRSTGVVIKALTPGGVAERDGRLQCGDHLLQIGDVNLRGFSSEQVATVLRQTGAQVRLIVARPIEPTAIDFQTLASHAPIIPTKLLSDPEELSRHLFQNPSFATSATSLVAMGGSSGLAGHCGHGGGGTSAGMALGLSGALSSPAIAAAAATDDMGISFFTTPDTELADLPLPPIPADLPGGTARMYPKDLDIVPISIVSPPPPPLPSLPLPQQQRNAMGFNAITNVNTNDTSTNYHNNNNNTKNNYNNNSMLNNQNSPQHNMDHIETVIATAGISSPTSDISSDTSSNYIDSPETETYEVMLRKNVYGLGITVAGYVCEEEDLSGIFVKSIIEGSAAEMSGQIQINDRIVAVDGRTLSGVTNHQAVELLRNTDIEVRLTLERFLRGRKYEHLQVALTELKGDTQSQISLPPSPSIATLSWLPPKSDADSIATDGGGVLLIECLPGDSQELPSRDTVESNMSHMLDRSEHSTGDRLSGTTPTTPQSPLTPENENKTRVLTNGTARHMNGHRTDMDTDEKVKSGKPIASTVPALKGAAAVTPAVTEVTVTTTTVAATDSPNADSLRIAWKSEFPESEIIVADINKLSGLGISLEGTVDVECGVEKRPHHYIRSILEDGPVGRQGILRPGDELLQVNQHKLQGLKHTEVVKILKELPAQVKLVCVRGATKHSIINTSQNAEAFETRSLLPGGHQSLQNLLSKAQSESSLYTSSTATLTDQRGSKSLENVSGLALWCCDVTTIEIEKTEHGFGFSILDYQDPLDPEGTVIVIRGLIRGGSAEATGEIYPGDRLVSVGEHSLQGLDLDEAVSILKGMPLGLTKLGICRPLSTSDSNSNSMIASPIGGNGGDVGSDSPNST